MIPTHSGRPVRRTGPIPIAGRRATGEEIILAASIEVMSEHGYHGTSVRDIAERAGLSPAALYHHFSSKHDVLATIMDRGIEELLSRTRTALQSAGDDPPDRLRALVAVHVLFHLEDQRGTLLGTSEVRGLEEPVRSEHLAKRQQQQRMFDGVVSDGTQRRAFRTEYPQEASRAVVVMCTGVASWYHPEGPLTREEIAQRYQVLALDLVGAA
ncbi:MAG: TetR family transcriptional regulator [Pseudonocardiaceae bacterium]|nr:TetR family transcriptional regulator [Pseudonocardiaceae bacterium]